MAKRLLTTTATFSLLAFGSAFAAHAQDAGSSLEPEIVVEETANDAVETIVIDETQPEDANAVETAETDSQDRSCVQQSAGASQAAIDSFKNNPNSLLVQNPLGGLALSNEVRSLVVSDVDTVPLILSIEEQANDRQSRAIGAGLARAAAICVATNPELAEEIQLAVAASENEALVTAFLTGAGNQDTAAIGGVGGGAPGGAAGGGGGAGGIGGSAGGGSTAFSSTSVGNPGAAGGGGGGGVFGGFAAADADAEPEQTEADGETTVQ
ncbi:MAG: hypothetical protein AAF619_07900 [Pseudomonadota bacterium]